MFKKQITYTNLNEETVTEDFYFNLTKAELMELEMSKEGGFSNYLNRVVKEANPTELVKIFKDLIIRSYGIKSENGKSFIKNDKIREEFLASDAYSELFMELVSDQKAGELFFNSIVPKIDDTKKFLENK